MERRAWDLEPATRQVRCAPHTEPRDPAIRAGRQITTHPSPLSCNREGPGIGRYNIPRPVVSCEAAGHPTEETRRMNTTKGETGPAIETADGQTWWGHLEVGECGGRFDPSLIEPLTDG